MNGTIAITIKIGILTTVYKYAHKIGAIIDIKLSSEDEIHIISHCDLSSADLENRACSVVIDRAIQRTAKKYAIV